MPDLLDALAACLPLLSEGFRRTNARLLAPEHLARLADRLTAYHSGRMPAAFPPPHLPGELTPPPAVAWEPFRQSVERWAADPTDPVVPAALAAVLTAAGTGGLLLVLGQRLTPGSLTDERAIPPTRAELLHAAGARPDGGPLTVAARALEKHAGRGTGSFWGPIRGSAEEKNRLAAHAVARVLDGATWWNVFPLGGRVVYEARVPSGHGARWAVPDVSFVGLVESFVPPAGG